MICITLMSSGFAWAHAQANFLCLRSKNFLTPGMVLLLSSNSETPVLKSFFSKGKKSSHGTHTALLLGRVSVLLRFLPKYS